MTNFTLFLVIVGAFTVTGWLFRLVDWIEQPREEKKR